MSKYVDEQVASRKIQTQIECEEFFILPQNLNESKMGKDNNSFGSST